MARKEKKEEGGGGQLWLVTFSDLMTLLLTFFVLLLSMSSMDQSVITRVNIFQADIGFMSARGAGKVPPRIKMIVDLLEKPWLMEQKPDRLTDLLFPNDVLPKDLNRSTLEKNLEVLLKPEGVAIVLTDKLLFPEGSAALTDTARTLLEQVAWVLHTMAIEVNVAGFADDIPTDDVSNKYDLSANRALAVLEYFLGQGFDNRRFTVSAYGPNLPMDKRYTLESQTRNRRVEILLKTDPFIGGYS